MAEQRPVASNRMVSSAGPRPPAAASLTPKEVLAILRRYMLQIILLTVVGMVAGGAIWYILKEFAPRYTARTYIEVLPPVETDPMTIGAVQVQEKILYGHRLTMANLIKQQSMLQDLLERDKVKETDWWLKSMGEDGTKAVKYLGRNLGAVAQRDSGFVEISMSCRKDVEAALIVNEMLALFLSQQGESTRTDVRDKLNRLEEQRVRVDTELRQAEGALDDVRKAWGIADLERPAGRYFQHTITLKLNQLELQKNELDLAIRTTQAEIQTLERIVTQPIAEQVEHAIERDPVMLVLAEQRDFQEARLTSILTKFGENHREVRQTQELIRGIEGQRLARKSVIAEQTRRANLANAQDRLVILGQRGEELEKLRQGADAKERDLNAARVQYDQRLKIRDERTAMVDLIQEQIEKLKIILNDPETPKVRQVGLAPKPLEQVTSRKWWLWIPAGTVLGFLAGVGIAFLRELANDLVRTPRDVSRYVRIPLLGVIPDSAEDSAVRGVDLCHVISRAPYSIISESYRRCRTNLKLSGSGESRKTLLVTSGSAGDGKTCVAVNLATAFVAEGRKALLIDANFRQPSLQKAFPRSAGGGLEGEPIDQGFGLSSALMGQCTYRQAVRSGGVEGLDVIDTGLLPPNPGELLGSVRMAELLDDARKDYDYIVIDSAPVLLVSDAKVLARLVDATVLVFNAAATRRGAAQRCVRELLEIGGKVVGSVLFGAHSLKGGYFQEQYRSYQRYQKAQLAGARG